MKFSIDNSTLSRLMLAFRGLIQAENRLLPTTAFLHLLLAKDKSGKPSLRIKASNGMVELTHQLEDFDQVDAAPGEALVNARKLQVISNNSSQETVFSVKCTDDLTEIKSTQGVFKLKALPPDQFPHMEVDVPDGAMDFSLRIDDLRFLITQTEYAMATVSDPRDYLKAILLAVEGERMVGVATDGHRLAYADVLHRGDAAGARRAVLPAPAVKEIKNLVSRSSEAADKAVKLLVDEKKLVLASGAMMLVAKVYEEKSYPDYQRIMPGEFAHQACVDSEDFSRSLAKMKIVDGTLAIVELGKSKLLMNARSDQEHEKVQIEQAAECTGEKFRVGINHEYLADVFAVIESEKALLEFKDPNSAILIREKDGSSARHIVMPLRL